ncbi:MAG: TIGR00341 family protein [Parcubacteria group bacterium]|nr:TIGR00341 family protein [Parcubacteria group bacterium]
MATTLFRTLTEEDKNEAIKRLIEESTPRDDFFLLAVLSVLMAVFGLLIDSIAVVIGSMLIAPLLSPILGISLGVVMADPKLIFRSLLTIGKAVAWTVPAAAIATLLFSYQAGLGTELTAEILARTEPSVINIAIAIIAGAAASFALIKPNLNASLPGVAISVAIIPPLAVTGIGLARLDWAMMTDSFILFVVNGIAIIFASMIIFSLMNLYVKRPLADKEILKEDAKLEKEKEEASDDKQEKIDITKNLVLEKVNEVLEEVEKKEKSK